jgi:hypothetical protein
VSRNSTSTAAASAIEVAPADRLVTLPPWDWSGQTPTLGFNAIRWAETWLIQPNGPRAGHPFRFTKDQATFLLWWYALDRRTGGWLFDHGVRRLAKGSGKSPFAAVFALIEFCAPVRLERFDDRELGGVRGKPVSMPWVQIAATAESQTTNTMRMVRAFAPKGSPVVREYGMDPGKTRYYRVPEGTLEVITSSATAAEGAESSAIIADETEHWLPSNGGVELFSTLGDNLAKSGARMLETSNAWKPGVGSVADATWDDWVAQEEGRSKRDARVLYDARIAPPDTDMADPVSLRAGLEHVYADCDWKRDPKTGALDLTPIMQKIWRASSKPDDSRRKYLNRPTVALDAWVEPEQFALLADHEAELVDGDRIVAFFDGSKSRDATALLMCRVSDGHVVTAGVWEPNPNDPNETVDVADVDRVVANMFARFKVAAFFADVREWESFALTKWPGEYGDRLELMAAPSARPPQPIAWDMRGHAYEFAKAAEACLSEIEDAAFTHDGHPALVRHVGNARRRSHRDAVTIGKETPDSPRKIDAAVCLIGVRMLRRMVLAADPPKRDHAGEFMSALLAERPKPDDPTPA